VCAVRSRNRKSLITLRHPLIFLRQQDKPLAHVFRRRALCHVAIEGRANAAFVRCQSRCNWFLVHHNYVSSLSNHRYHSSMTETDAYQYAPWMQKRLKSRGWAVVEMMVRGLEVRSSLRATAAASTNPRMAHPSEEPWPARSRRSGGHGARSLPLSWRTLLRLPRSTAPAQPAFGVLGRKPLVLRLAHCSR
jgi:hypothetical protein